MGVLKEMTIPCVYDKVNSFQEGLASVKNDDKWGFVDTSGQIRIPCVYDEAGGFHEGLASVKIGDKWGFIDTMGQIVIPCEYKIVGYFSRGYAIVSSFEEGRQEELSVVKDFDFKKTDARNVNLCMFGVINKKGEYVIQPTIQSLSAGCISW